MAANSAIIYDTNVWVAYYDEDDATHRRAERLIDSTTDNIVLPEYVCVELCTVLKHKVDQERATLASEMLLENNDIVLLPSSGYFHSVVELFRSYTEPHLSFVDVSLLLLSKEYQVVTFDKKLERAIKQFSRNVK